MQLFASGSRLKSHVIVGSDGSQQWLGWHDTQAQEDCSFVSDGAGTLRCLPAVSQVVFFSDSKCTTPLVAIAGCTVPQHATLCGQTCGGVSGCHTYALGNQWTGGSVYLQGTSSCIANAIATFAADTFWQTGSDLTSSYVAASSTIQ